MGWLFSSEWQSKQAIVVHLTRTQENDSGKWETVRSSVVGNHLWAIQTVTPKTGEDAGKTDTYIVLFLLEAPGRYHQGWGYKDMDESMGPYTYDCPLSFLDQCPPPTSPYAAGWREKVRQWHQNKASQRATATKVAVGQWWALKPGCRPAEVRIVRRSDSGRAWIGLSPDSRLCYRIRSRLLDHQIQTTTDGDATALAPAGGTTQES